MSHKHKHKSHAMANAPRVHHSSFVPNWVPMSEVPFWGPIVSWVISVAAIIFIFSLILGAVPIVKYLTSMIDELSDFKWLEQANQYVFSAVKTFAFLILVVMFTRRTYTLVSSLMSRESTGAKEGTSGRA